MSNPRNNTQVDNEVSYIRSKRRANFLEFGTFLSVGATAVAALKDGLAYLLSNPVVQYAAAPVASVMSFFEIIAAWHQAAKSREGHALARAIMVTLTGAALIAAGVIVIGSFAAAAFVLPILTVAAFGVKSLFDLGSALYFTIAGLRSSEEIRSSYLARAGEAFLSGLLYGVVAAAIGVTAFIAGPALQLAAGFAALGAAVAATVFCFVRAGQIGKAQGQAESTEPYAAHANSNWVSTSAFYGATMGRGALLGSSDDDLDRGHDRDATPPVDTTDLGRTATHRAAPTSRMGM